MRDIIRAESCLDAWLTATEHLRKQDEWRDYNLVLEITRPMRLSKIEKQISSEVNGFLVSNGKHSISTIINTIFPASLYAIHGASELFERYREIRPMLEDHKDTKWGTYFMRMTTRTDNDGGEINPLAYLINKLRHQVEIRAPKRAVYELNLVEPFLDIPIYDPATDKGFHMGGPCLSHLSFKLKGDRSLLLTALYRSHYYIERALGNFYGLAMLQDFVARQAGIEAAELVCHSTMAVLDNEGIRKGDVTNMLDKCVELRKLLVIN
jgi:thymidylate synthase